MHKNIHITFCLEGIIEAILLIVGAATKDTDYFIASGLFAIASCIYIRGAVNE